MKQYIELVNKVINEGEWVYNQRTNTRCLTIINADLVYDLRDGKFPVLTTKKMAWKSAIAEMLGYIRGYRWASEFRTLGTKTWDANTNENAEWLSNPHRMGTDDMGRAYGVQGRSWLKYDWDNKTEQFTPTIVDQLQNVVNDLIQHKDNRREIVTFWNPGEMDRMCLPPCMHTHTFSVLNDTLYLTSYQRSADIPLGLPFNSIQVAWLLQIMAHISGLKPGIAYHKIVNAHVYENQLDLLKEQISREPHELPILLINPKIKTFEDINTWVTVDDFSLEYYHHHPAIKFPFTV